ncbi:hypothetical protein CLOM_g17075 [Closterium sp. NIES-68]|nr:hypothetical protein CLOM_g17075 [Closterium sp. NIES-68]
MAVELKPSSGITNSWFALAAQDRKSAKGSTVIQFSRTDNTGSIRMKMSAQTVSSGRTPTPTPKPSPSMAAAMIAAALVLRRLKARQQQASGVNSHGTPDAGTLHAPTTMHCTLP